MCSPKLRRNQYLFEFSLKSATNSFLNFDILQDNMAHDQPVIKYQFCDQANKP